MLQLMQRNRWLAFLMDFLQDWAVAGVYLNEVKNYEKTSFTPFGNIPLNVPSGAGPGFQRENRPGDQGKQLAAAI